MYAAPPAAQASSTGLTGLDISSRLGMSSTSHQHRDGLRYLLYNMYNIMCFIVDSYNFARATGGGVALSNNYGN